MKVLDGKNIVCATSESVPTTTIKDFVGMKLPTAFLINKGAYGYGKFIYDENTIVAFESKLKLIEDSLDRK